MKFNLIVCFLFIGYINAMDEPLLDIHHAEAVHDVHDIISIRMPIAYSASVQAAFAVALKNIRHLNNKKQICKNLIFCSIIGCWSLWIFLLAVNSTAAYLIGK